MTIVRTPPRKLLHVNKPWTLLCRYLAGKQEGAEGNKALQKDVAHANRCYDALAAHFRDEVSIRVALVYLCRCPMWTLIGTHLEMMSCTDYPFLWFQSTIGSCVISNVDSIVVDILMTLCDDITPSHNNNNNLATRWVYTEHPLSDFC